MPTTVPFFRPDVEDAEILEVVDTLRTGWLTTGPKVRRFEQEFAAHVGAAHAVALNSCTAALHLAVEALGLQRTQAVLVPTLTFAATAEVVRYLDAVPVLVDCDPVTLQMDLADAAARLGDGATVRIGNSTLPVVGIIPVHVGGSMMDVARVRELAARHQLWVVEDAAHSFPAAWRRGPGQPWQRCGEHTADASCFSFYANKTITTGEGGMLVTDDERVAARARMMSLHGLSSDAWGRYSGSGSWDYHIVAPGYKYNLTDIAAAIGVHQLRRAEAMRQARERTAREFLAALSHLEELELPPDDDDRIHSWHLFPIRLRLDRITISRNEFVEELKRRGVGCSVHWRPLHLHPYYQDLFGYRASDLPAASSVWPRLISLPIFSTITPAERAHVVATVEQIVLAHRRRRFAVDARDEHAPSSHADPVDVR
jgi:dTDP-4-amino-4,6-dideoxygalactose transaminase